VSAANIAADRDPRSESRRDRANQRARMAPLKKRIDRIEAEIAEREGERSRIQHELADPALYESGRSDRIAALVHEQGRLAQAITALEDAWLDAHGALDSAQADS
jgi:ATP-binding cassette subfamily F protein 3